MLCNKGLLKMLIVHHFQSFAKYDKLISSLWYSPLSNLLCEFECFEATN